MKNLFTIVIGLVLSISSFAQGDDCSTALNLGTLPTPSGCTGINNGQGTDVINALTNIGATAENPYTSILDCNGGTADQASPAADVWVTFVASSQTLDITITGGLNGVNIGLYQGTTCGALTPIHCDLSNNGSLATTYNAMVPGDQYFLQISGQDETDQSNFNLTLNNSTNCAQCAQDVSLTATPPPVNGVYQPGTTVTFCATVGSFTEVNVHWIHGISPLNFGPGWDMSTLVPSGAVSPTDVTWIWTSTGVPQAGWYVDLDGDGQVNDGYGDNNMSPNLTACWQLTTVTPAACVNGVSANLNVETYSDGETGSYTSGSCTGDPVMSFNAIVSCCDFPITSFVNPSCDNTTDGSVSATGQGGTAPYDYVWTDALGNVVSTDNNLANGVASTASNLGNGTYTVTVTDFNGCSKLVDVTIAGPACPPCILTGITANAAITCPSTTYSTTGTLTFSNAPTTGTLTVSDCNGNQQVFNAPFTSPQNYTLTGQTADGLACAITAVFSADAACTISTTPIAPICPCNITNFTTNIGSCDAATDTYPVNGTVEFDMPPTSGVLTISVDNGSGTTYDTVIVLANFVSPLNYSISGIPSNSAASTISATFSADAGCTSAIAYTAPQSCACAAAIGTFNTFDDNATNTDFVLCFGDNFTYQSNGDYTPPADIGGANAYNPGLAYLIYSCPPTAGTEPNLDPCLEGIFSDGTGAVTMTDLNDLLIINSFPAGTFTNNTVYYVPITMYDIVGNFYSNVIAPNPPCYELGTPVAVQYLPEIKTTEVEDCQAGTITSTIIGGLPEIDGSNYSVVAGSLTPANASFVNTTAGFNGTITIQGLTNGQAYSFNITDGNGCPVTVSGTFIGTEDPGFSYDNYTICQNGTDPNVTITGDAGSFSYAVVSGGPTLSLNTTSGAVDASASSPGVYDITYLTNDPTCFSDSTVQMTINLTPIVDPVTDQTVCDGAPFSAISFTGTTGATFTWTNNNTSIGLGANGSGNISAFNGTNAGASQITGLITVTPTLGTCVGTPTTFNLNVDPIPVVNAGVDQTVCTPNAVTLTATNPNGATISWDNGVNDGVAFNPAIGTITYTVTANLAGCISTDQVNVTVNPLPTVGAGVDITICEGIDTTLTATNPDGATLTWDNGVTDGVSFTPPVGVTTTYTVTADLLTCISTDQVNITVNPLPIFAVAGTDPTTCGGNDGFVTISGLNASTSYQVTYNDGAVQGPTAMNSDAAGNIIISGLTAGSYTDFVVSLAGCPTTDNTVITLVDPSAPPVGAGADQTVCDPTQVTLTATNPSGAIITWDNGVTDGTAFSSPIGTTLYTVTANLAGCISTDQVNVTVNPLPTIGAGPDQTLCDGILVNLIATNPDNATISWDNGVTNGIAFQSPIGTTTYTVTATLLGCVSTDAVDITVNALDNSGFSYPTYSYCTAEANPVATISGTTGGTFSFTATSGGPNLSINTSTGLIDLANSNPGTYDITYTTPGVCPLDSTITMNIALTPSVNPVTDQTICHNTDFTFININGSAGSTFDWVNDNTSIGLAASGTGNTIPNFTGTNTTLTPQTGVITVTPSAGSCVGTPTSFNLTVNPLDNPGFNFPITSYCTTDANPTPTIDVAGGTFSSFTTSGAGTIDIDVNTGTINLANSNDGVYNITYTTAGPDCPQDSTISITINLTPTVDPIADQLVCEGGSFLTVDFTGTGNPTFDWTNDNTNIGLAGTGTGDILPFTTTSAGGLEVSNMTVTPSTAACTGTPETFILSVNPSDNPGFSYANYVFCTTDTDPTPSIDVAGGTFTFNPTAGGPNLVIDAATGTIDLDASDEGVYDITYTTAGPCVQDSTVSVTINFTPTINTVADQTVCHNGNGDFTDFTAISFSGINGTLPTTYDWTNDNTAIGLGASGTGDIASFTGTNTSATQINGIVTVTPSTTECIGTPTAFNLIVNPLDDPSFQYVDGLTYCATGAIDPTVNIAGTTGGTFGFTINSGGPTLVFDSNTGGIDLSASDVGSYDITYTTAAACPQSSTLTLVITNAPIADFTSGIYCANDADPLPTYINNGSGGVFSSTAGLVINSSTGMVDLDASTAGVYTITNTIDLTAQGCALAIATDDITINEIPTATISGTTTICPTDPLPDVQVDFTNPANGPFDLTYTFNGATQNVTSANPFILSGAQFGSYNLVSVTDANGCTNAAIGNVIIDSFATPTIDPILDISLCEGSNATIPAFTGTPSGNTFDWTLISGTDVGFGTSGTGTIGNFTGMNPQTVTVEVTPTSSNGCVGSPLSMNVTVNPLPIVDFTADNFFGCEPFTVNFTESNTNSVKCIWDFGDGTIEDNCGTVSHTYVNAGVYDVTMTAVSIYDCQTSHTETSYITVTPMPVAAFSFTPEVTDVSHTEIEFTNSSIDADYYEWNFGDETALSNETDPTHVYGDEPQQYQITLLATNNNGMCRDSVEAFLTVNDIILYYVPNVFTPDFDAFNQTFKPIFTSGFDPQDYHLMIFNRWGELIFESYNSAIGWDGTYPEDGKLCQDGVYVWKIIFKETMSDKKHNITGHVTLLK